MAKRIWRGDAPDIPQIDVVEFDGDAVVAEGSDLILTINDKQIVVEAPAAVTDLAPDQEGDTHGVRTLLAAAAAAINGSEIPEFAELEAVVENPDPSEDAPYHRLTLTSREPGRPFTVEVSAPQPAIDIDVLQVGGPGQNERQRFWFAPTPAGGTYTVSWNLGSGLETSAVVPFNATADALKAALIAGMPSLTAADLVVTGAGTTANPFVLELTGALAETSVPSLGVNADQLTGNGQVSVATLQDGDAGTSDTILQLTLLGSCKLRFNGQTTAATFGTATPAATIQSALEGLSTIGPGNVAVYGGSVIVGSSVKAVFLVHFRGDLAGAAHSLQVVNVSGSNYTNMFQSGAQAASYETYVAWFDQLGGTTGTFSLTHDGNTTGAFTVGTTAPATIQAALEALPSIGSGNVLVYAIGGACHYQIQFIAALAGTDVPDLTLNDVSLSGTYDFDKVLDGSTSSAVNERWSLVTNGAGGTFTLTKPGGGTSSPLAAGIAAGDLQTALEGLYGGTWTVTGSGVSGDPWIAEAGGALAGVDLVPPTGDGSLLTGGFEAPVQTLQDGSPPRPQQWSVALHGATGGAWRLEFLGRVTAALAHDANAAAVEAALVGLEPGDFGGLFDVSGAGSFADPFVIEVAGRLAGSAQALIAHNEQLTGLGQTLSHATRQAATGRHWWDNPANWREFDTGDPGVPQTGDDVWVQTGDDSNSILYGLEQSAVKLNSFVLSSLFSGSIGLPLRSENGYVEYRPRHLAIGFAADGEQTLLIGNDRGQGSGRINLDTGTDEVHIRVERTDGPLEPGFQALNWRGTHAANTLTLIEGFVGIAAFAFETAELAQVVQRGGVLQLGPGTAIASGGLDKTSGDLYSDGATIGGVPLIIRG